MRALEALGFTMVAAGAVLQCADVKAATIKQIELYTPTTATAPVMQPLDAMATIRRNFDTRRSPRVDLQWKGSDLRWNGFPCSKMDFPKDLSYVITGLALTIRCIDGAEHVYPYSKLSNIRIFKVGSPPWTPWWTFTCMSATGVRDLCVQSFDLDELKSLANSFYALATSRPVKTPSTDPDFLAAVAAAKLTGDRSEDQRRTMVEAEALLKQDRSEHALAVYLDTLKTSPDWAIGHYNLALIYASLELYPEAITEMKRYLHLAPDAADSREARDQVYAWQALLPR